jgi:hypothetical protein
LYGSLIEKERLGLWLLGACVFQYIEITAQEGDSVGQGLGVGDCSGLDTKPDIHLSKQRKGGLDLDLYLSLGFWQLFRY